MSGAVNQRIYLGMETQQSGDYYARRAEEERAAADHAADERAAQPHRELADRYGRLAAGKELAANDRDGPMSDPGILPKEFRIVP